MKTNWGASPRDAISYPSLLILDLQPQDIQDRYWPFPCQTVVMSGWEKHTERKLSWKVICLGVSATECVEGKILLTFSGFNWLKKKVSSARNTTARKLIDLNVHFARSSLDSASIALFLGLCRNPFWAEAHTWQPWIRRFFSINKSPTSEVERSKYFPQLVSKPLKIHTCPLCSEK